MNQKFKKQTILISFFIFILCIILFDKTICSDIIIKRIDNVVFTNKYNNSHKTYIPAAYTNQDGSIEGEYRIDGKTYGTPSRKERISLHPTKGMIISGQWHSDNGFQQTVLVKAYKARKFDDNRKRIRRALCTESSTSPCYFIIQSTRRMTLNEFAEECRKYCYHAVNLDMGTYGFSQINSRFYSIWSIFNKHKQTNWIIN